jgi:HEAT repeat protein
MKRWLVLLFLAATLGIGYLLAWPYLFPKDPLAHEQNAKIPAQIPHVKQQDDGGDPVLKALTDELAAGGNQPAVNSRKQIQLLASLGTKGQFLVPLIEAWLRRMHSAKLVDTPEFRELAEGLLAVDPSTPKRLVAELNRQDLLFDRSYHAETLLAFRKTSLSAVIDGLKVNEGNIHEADSALPVVLSMFGAEAVPELCAALRHAYPAVRRQSIRALAEMGALKAGDAAGDLAKAMNDTDVGVRFMASLALGELADRQKAAPAELTAALHDSDGLVRLAAARSLNRFLGVDSQQLASVVSALLAGNALSLSGWDLGSYGQSMQPFAEAKGSFDYNALYWEETVAHILIELGPNCQLSLETLLAMLQKCPHDGHHIVHMLAAQKDSASKVVPALREMLASRDSRMRRKALIALGRLGMPAVANALADVSALLDQGDGRTRWRAFLALALLDPAAIKQKLPSSLHSAVDAAAISNRHPRIDMIEQWSRCVWQHHPGILQPATSDGAEAVKRLEPWTLSDEEVWIEKQRVGAVLAAVAKDGPHGKPGVPFLLTAWQANNRSLQERKLCGDKALELLAREGPDAADAAPALVNALHWYPPRDLTAALLKIGEPALPALISAIDDPEQQDIHTAAMVVLQQFGPKAKPALPSLLRMLTTPDETIAAQAAASVGAVGSAATDAVAPLLKIAASPNHDGRRHAIDALGLIGSPAKAALPALIAFFSNNAQQTRAVAIRAVYRIGQDAVEPLTKALGDADPNVRISSVQALAKLGKEGVEPLTKALGDKDEKVRINAIEGLAIVGPEAIAAMGALEKLDREDQSAAIREAVRRTLAELPQTAAPK